MNGTLAEAKALASVLRDLAHADSALSQACDFVICPPFVHLCAVEEILQGSQAIILGAQDCSGSDNGAFTGDISAAMLKDIGVQFVIAGHSERRQGHGESDLWVHQKVKKIHQYEMAAILCIGETEEQREDGQEDDVVLRQLAASLPVTANAFNTVIAYEPVWAIGTGKTASVAEIAHMHGIIRARLKETLEDGANMRILYGGSVKPDNALEILGVPDVDGALIGGASLKADDFLKIARAVL